MSIILSTSLEIHNKIFYRINTYLFRFCKSIYTRIMLLLSPSYILVKGFTSEIYWKFQNFVVVEYKGES